MPCIYPYDVVVAILYFARKSGTETVYSGKEYLHDVFRALKKRYPSLFVSFSFKDNGFFFESETLDQVFLNLEAKQLLSHGRLLPDRYSLTKKLDEAFEEYTKARIAKAGITDLDLEEASRLFVLFSRLYHRVCRRR